MCTKLFLVLLLLPVGAMAGDFTCTGVGGGGWLHSGAILPTNSDVVVVGGDMIGPYRTDDFGTTWYPWTEGLANADRMLTNHVQDLLGIDYGTWTGFFAATEGGIYYADENGDWETTTPIARYSYKKNPNVCRVYPFPFSCLDWRGDSLVVAGAGRTSWDLDYCATLGYEQGDYPGLESMYAYGDYDGQWTVWTMNLEDGDPNWDPDTTSEFGAARDISFTMRNDTTYIVVGTATGIYLKGPSGWSSVCDTLYDEGLTCRSLHLTNRGALYVAMRWAGASCARPTGVYRLFDVGDPTEWTYLDDGTELPPCWLTVEETGDLSWAALIEISVVDGDSTDPDLLYLGSRSREGLFRGLQPYNQDSLCHWEHKMYGDPESGYYHRDCEDVEQELDPGWYDYGGLALIFPAVVSPYHPEAVVIAPCGRLYVSRDSGDSWTQSYTTNDGCFWSTTGYNEIGTVALAFMDDGRLLESTLEHGLFRSYDENLDKFEYLHPPTGHPTASNNVPYNPQSAAVVFRPNWRGSADAVIFISGDLRRTPNKLMWIDEEDNWYNLTCDLSGGDKYKLADFIFTDDDTCFITYTKFDAKVGTAGAHLLEFGVLRGCYQVGPGEWLWSACNNGLTAVSSPVFSYAYGVDLLYHEASGRIFLAARGTNGLFLGQTANTWVPGGIYMLSSAADTTWELEFGGAGTEYQSFRCLAQSLDGDVIYAGSHGTTWDCTGTVLRCDYPDTSETTWIAMANTDSTGYPFGFEAPEGTNWDNATANRWLTVISCLAVDPWDKDIIYAGFGCDGFTEQNGLWKYSPEGGWEKISTGEAFDSQTVKCFAIKKALQTAKFAVGTRGLELFYTTLENSTAQIGSEAPGEGKISYALTLEGIRTELGGRTEISFMLERPGPVKMRIYDVTGRLMHYHQADFSAGSGSLIWNGRTRKGGPCASGIYFLRLSAGDVNVDGKFLLIR
jgi:hypothetical protein